MSEEATYDQQFGRIEFLLQQILDELQKKKAPRQIHNSASEALRLANLWNEWKELKMPAVGGLSPQSSRHKNAVARWKEKPDQDYWVKVIQKINESKFCNGDNEREWVADFEFLVRPDVHYRVLEGKYDKCHTSFKQEPHTVQKIVGYTEDGIPVKQTFKTN